MRRLALILPLLAGLWSAVLPAAPEALRQFDSPDQRERYNDLLEELRCLVCQNESLANSPADLAQDLRDEVYRLLVTEGRSREAAIAFLTDRYGDFVLYRPPLRPATWLLWFGPLLMLVIGAVVLVAVVGHRRRAPEPRLADDEHERAERLLRGDGDGDGP